MMAMTKTKLLEVARRTPTKNGFKVEVEEFWKRKRGGDTLTAQDVAMRGHVRAWRVRLRTDVGFPNASPTLLTTESQATACEARDRFWMWLRAEGLTRG